MASSLLVSSTIFPRSIYRSNPKLSIRHFNKHLAGQLCTKNIETHKTPRSAQALLKSPLSGTETKPQLLRCSYSSTSSSVPGNNLSFDSWTAAISQLTPLGICKWSFIFATGFVATKWVVNLLLSPFFWVYFSWCWLFWPWFVAISVGVYGIYCLKKYSSGNANAIEQLGLVFSAFTWILLVPPACANGFLEGWPVVFFFVYHFFFLLNASVRNRLYGDLYPCEHDPKWDLSLPNQYITLFCGAVAVAHWLAAFEGPQLHLIPGGWSTLGIWILIVASVFMQYHSTWYVAKYSKKVVVPTAVVQFGPYRWVRHPMYASTMLLFATYFAALRAPFSSLFVVAVCLAYYEQKVKLEEALMLESFGERYKEYMKNVRSLAGIMSMSFIMEIVLYRGKEQGRLCLWKNLFQAPSRIGFDCYIRRHNLKDLLIWLVNFIYMIADPFGNEKWRIPSVSHAEERVDKFSTGLTSITS